MLESVGLGVDGVERQAQGLHEVLLQQPVMADHLERDPLALGRQRRPVVAPVLDEAQ
jgi:hypothetical protein